MTGWRPRLSFLWRSSAGAGAALFVLFVGGAISLASILSPSESNLASPKRVLLPHDLPDRPFEVTADPDTPVHPKYEEVPAAPLPSARGEDGKQREGGKGAGAVRGASTPPVPSSIVGRQSPREEAGMSRPVPRLTPNPVPTPRAVESFPPNVLTPREIRTIRRALRLTPEQEPHWPPVEGALLGIGAQQMDLIKRGQDPKAALASDNLMRVYWVSRPFLQSLREEQKALLRQKAQSIGFGSAASYL